MTLDSISTEELVTLDPKTITTKMKYSRTSRKRPPRELEKVVLTRPGRHFLRALWHDTRTKQWVRMTARFFPLEDVLYLDIGQLANRRFMTNG